VFVTGARAELVESAALALPGAVREIALSGDGSVGAIAIAGDADSVSELLVFSALDLTVLKRFPVSVYCVDVSHDGNLIAYGVINSGVYVYNVALDSSTLVREAIPPAQVGQGSFTWTVHAVALSPDSTRLAAIVSSSGSNQYGQGFTTYVHLYDLASLTELGAAMTLSSASGNSTTTFGGGTRDVVFTADGTRLVTGDGTTTTPFSFPTPGTCSSTGAGLRVIDIATRAHQRVGLGFLPKAYLSLGGGQVCAYSATLRAQPRLRLRSGFRVKDIRAPLVGRADGTARSPRTAPTSSPGIPARLRFTRGRRCCAAMTLPAACRLTVRSSRWAARGAC
jgi:hypothetical protein